MCSHRFPPIGTFAASAALAWAVCSTSVWATTLDDIGITQLRLDTNNTLLGQGVVVAQPEANVAEGSLSFEISASAAGVTVPVVYIYYDNTQIITTTYDSSLYSWHAGAVAANLAGATAGVAPDLSEIVNYQADYYINFVLQDYPLSYAPKVINQSFIENPDAKFTAPILDQFFDNYVAQRHYIIATAAGNGGGIQSPGSAYNVITVGAYQGSSSVSQPGQLCKPDIVAPADATSFSTPYVSGVAALLVQAAGSGNGVDPRVVKALLLNGATKPPGWTHSSTAPLDRTYGAGIVNADNSYHNLIAGKHGATSTTTTASLGAAHPPTATGNLVAAGWNLGTLTSNANADAVDHYVLDLSQDNAIVSLTATLTWQRANDQALANEYLTNATNPNFTTFTSPLNTINNLDLYLYNATTQSLVDLSNSGIDNVEHLYTLNLTPGKYDLQVLKNGGSPGIANVFSPSETYGLAWNAGNLANVTVNNNLVFSQSNAVTIPSTISGAGSLTQAGSGTTTLMAYRGIGPVNVNAGRLAFAATGVANTKTVVISALSIAGTTNAWTATVDIGNNSMVVKAPATGSGEAAQAQARIVANQIKSGLNVDSAHLWQGTGITSSTADVYDNTQGNNTLYAVASIQNNIIAAGASDGTTNDVTPGNAIYTVFGVDNTPVALNDTLVRYTLFGDADLDGQITGTDFFLLNSGLTAGTSGWLNGCFDGGATVDGTDFFLIYQALAWQQSQGDSFVSLLVSAPSAGAFQAPEPATLPLLALASAALCLRRRPPQSANPRPRPLTSAPTR